MKKVKIWVITTLIMISFGSLTKAQTTSSFQLLSGNTGNHMKFLTKDVIIGGITYNTGFAGLGVTSPVQKLHIVGGNILLTSGAGNISGSNGSIFFGKDYNLGLGYIHGEWGIEYYDNNTQKGLNFWKPFSSTSQTMNFAMFLSNSGNVGIGTNNPVSKFHVEGDAFIYQDLQIGNGTKESNLRVQGNVFSSSLETGSGKKMVVADESGQLQIQDLPTDENWNHIATQNIKMTDFGLSYNGSFKAMKLDESDNIIIDKDLTVGQRILGKSNQDSEDFGKLELWGSKNDDAARIELWQGGANNERSMKFAVYESTADFQFFYSEGGSLIRKFLIAKNSIIAGTPSNKIDLNVNGIINANEVKVTAIGWSDYVFEPTYELMPLSQIEAFINTNRHLPGIPSAKTVTENGIQLGEMNALLLMKIEELTLYVIEQQKEIKALKDIVLSNN
jgi:hypothetical protein